MDWRDNYYVTCFLCRLRYATIELCFLRCPCSGYITRVRLLLRMVLRSAITASSSATSGQTASSLPAACDAGAVTCTRSALRKGIYLPPQHAATVGWRKEKNPVPQIIGAADTRRRRCRKRIRRGHPGLQREMCSLPPSPLQVSFSAALRGRTEERQQAQAHQVADRSRYNGAPSPCGPTPTRTADNRSVSSGH
jgi:hypothetical protein